MPKSQTSPLFGAACPPGSMFPWRDSPSLPVAPGSTLHRCGPCLPACLARCTASHCRTGLHATGSRQFSVGGPLLAGRGSAQRDVVALPGRTSRHRRPPCHEVASRVHPSSFVMERRQRGWLWVPCVILSYNGFGWLVLDSAAGENIKNWYYHNGWLPKQKSRGLF